jgi:hypothetical protein
MTLHKVEEERLRAYEEQRKHSKNAQMETTNYQYNQYVVYPAQYNMPYQGY